MRQLEAKWAKKAQIQLHQNKSQDCGKESLDPINAKLSQGNVSIS